jgi:hypothetical protein
MRHVLGVSLLGGCLLLTGCATNARESSQAPPPKASAPGQAALDTASYCAFTLEWTGTTYIETGVRGADRGRLLGATTTQCSDVGAGSGSGADVRVFAVKGRPASKRVIGAGVGVFVPSNEQTSSKGTR